MTPDIAIAAFLLIVWPSVAALIIFVVWPAIKKCRRR